MNDTSTTRSGTAAAWVIYVLQLLLSAVLALLAITSVFMTDSCGSVSDEPAVCDTDYFGAVLFGYWIALAVLLVLVPIAIVRASRRGRPAWLRALGGIVVTVALTVGFVMLMVR
ncbi:hypothetical protein [Aeromicrobium fastidiosum]|uniref:Uncharacterized protein n=1 Tax=Aeromicrobium fastidiosum TaxID=52699 RepID=A0A641ASS8_9ACTN|nr:hypothetical protein [Aeromicrobium fastidiosum]KAA1380293.1 hypothetical protein ESP62_003605 [Aeromicrobium fastidiosum]MBP2389847.1 hypothetical protein [Aeromicrobium fastidiosum]